MPLPGWSPPSASTKAATTTTLLGKKPSIRVRRRDPLVGELLGLHAEAPRGRLRIANTLGGVPEGSGWHRALLEGACLDVPKVRPPVLSEHTAQSLERYLAFRHRFRNLYLFDLDAALLAPLLQAVPEVWRGCRGELEIFATALENIADAV